MRLRYNACRSPLKINLLSFRLPSHLYRVSLEAQSYVGSLDFKRHTPEIVKSRDVIFKMLQM